MFLCLMIRRPPRSTRTYTLLPYTTRFRSGIGLLELAVASELLVDERVPVGVHPHRVVDAADTLEREPVEVDVGGDAHEGALRIHVPDDLVVQLVHVAGVLDQGGVWTFRDLRLTPRRIGTQLGRPRCGPRPPPRHGPPTG